MIEFYLKNFISIIFFYEIGDMENISENLFLYLFNRNVQGVMQAELEDILEYTILTCLSLSSRIFKCSKENFSFS